MRLVRSVDGLNIMKQFQRLLFMLVLAWTIAPSTILAQESVVFNPNQSVARNWNEALLFAIRRDLARPTVHARNLFHSAAAMYDTWALFEPEADLYFLGRYSLVEPTCRLTDDERMLIQNAAGNDTQRIYSAREVALSYAQYRLLNHRFRESPGAAATLFRFDQLFIALGHDASITTTEITEVTPYAAAGNRVADCIIAVGLADGSNEASNYVNQDYQPVNPAMNPAFPGTPELTDPNRWQPLDIENFIDQSGISTEIPLFLGAEWGRVQPFAMSAEDATRYVRDSVEYMVYHDPGPPALLSTDGSNDHYQWGHSLVVLWSSHLDPNDGVLWDVSPANMGNTTSLPTDLESLKLFYNRLSGGSTDQGHRLNPATGKPYTPQLVPRGDYTRVLAEFWADGPGSETPPGHWFNILNTEIIDHPDFEKRFAGEGPVLDDLQFDVYAYFTLGGAMHDSAIAAWSIKGWYDYIRPISALRYMAQLGQSSDITQSSYHLLGIPLQPGQIEIVGSTDILAGNGGVNIGKIKVLAWRGPNFIINPDFDVAGVDWILLENWWPYQRPSFVTPPFAGYVSGHSTFSRAAAEVLTRLTGNAFFPGGMGEFVAKENEFLVFEDGPSVDVRLQWATFRDAADQTSLSRIWGGIHPPVDDVPGRRIGIRVGNDAFDHAVAFFNGEASPLSLQNDFAQISSSRSGAAFWVVLCLALILAIKIFGLSHRVTAQDPGKSSFIRSA